jgi:hypothetical protein
MPIKRSWKAANAFHVVGEGRVLGHQRLGVEDVLRLATGLLAAGREVGGDRGEGGEHGVVLEGRVGGPGVGARLGQRIGHLLDGADGHSTSDANAL